MARRSGCGAAAVIAFPPYVVSAQVTIHSWRPSPGSFWLVYPASHVTASRPALSSSCGCRPRASARIGVSHAVSTPCECQALCAAARPPNCPPPTNLTIGLQTVLDPSQPPNAPNRHHQAVERSSAPHSPYRQARARRTTPRHMIRALPRSWCIRFRSRENARENARMSAARHRSPADSNWLSPLSERNLPEAPTLRESQHR